METEKSKNHLLTPVELKTSLAEKINNLFFPSESDRPIEIISSEESADVKSLLAGQSTDTNQKTAAGNVSFEDFYAKYGVEKDWQNSAQKEFAFKFGSALQLMQDNLSNIQVARVGQVEITIYIAGQTPEGEWIGLKTVSVETGE